MRGGGQFSSYIRETAIFIITNVMHPKRYLISARSLALRHVPKRLAVHDYQRCVSSASKDSPPVENQIKGATQAQAPHVSEEQAALDASMGETPPDLDQGTPVQEVLPSDQDFEPSAH